MFSLVFGKELLNGALILNRGITFYLFVVISLIVVIINAIIKKNIKGEIDKDFGDSSQIPANNLMQDRIFRRVPKSIKKKP